MLTRTKVLDLTIAALLILTLAPGPATAGAPVEGTALAAALTTRALESLNTLSDSEAYFSALSATPDSSGFAVAKTLSRTQSLITSHF